jgi:hypothetical protein
MLEHGIKWGIKSPLNFSYDNDLRILDENIGKMNKVLEVF